MSDTVKVIIEIPKETYLEIKEGFIARNAMASAEIIQNGIPLDSVKAEIEKKCDRINSIASVLRYPQHREIQELLCEILESIGKAESEDKE